MFQLGWDLVDPLLIFIDGYSTLTNPSFPMNTKREQSTAKKTYTITRDQAMKAGLLVCKHCGWPENNHFKGGTCAHDGTCPGYEETLRTL